MKKLLLVPLVAVVVLVACQDLRRDPSQVAVPHEALLSASGGDGSTTGPSTVCVAYQSQLSRAQEDGDSERAAILGAIIDDACN